MEVIGVYALVYLIGLSTGQNVCNPEETVDLHDRIKDEVREEIEAMSEEGFEGAI